MPRITPLHWRKFEKFLLFVGCTLERERGDHRIYWRQDLLRPIVIPRDTEVPVFIIRNCIRTLGIGQKDFLQILKNI